MALAEYDQDEPPPLEDCSASLLTQEHVKGQSTEFLKLDRKDDLEEQLKREMKDLMKPTQELVSEVLSNKEIQAGLEDPEIMMAVQDIASNPAAMHKYKHYPKIVNFYNSMGKLMGDRIEKQEKAKNKMDGSKCKEF